MKLYPTRRSRSQYSEKCSSLRRFGGSERKWVRAKDTGARASSVDLVAYGLAKCTQGLLLRSIFLVLTLTVYDRNWRDTLSFDGRRSHPLLSSKPGVKDSTNTARMFDGLFLTASGLIKTVVSTCPTSIRGAVLICALFLLDHSIPKDNMMHCAPSCLTKDSVVGYVVWEAAWIFGGEWIPESLLTGRQSQ